MDLYPLKFKPRFLEKIWGGRKFQTILGKPIPPEKLIGESWELYDFPPGVIDKSGKWVSSEVANGPLAGRTLHELLVEHGPAIHGDVPLVKPKGYVGDIGPGQFPLLVKFLDAREDLSVQVHPPQKYADEHPDAHLKTEAWYVMQHDAGARVLKGLKPAVNREAFEAAIHDGTVESMIEAIPVKDGQCHFLQSGTIHALGAGILAAEVQTPSDTTFRVFDFDRVDATTGKKRELHIEQAMKCIDFSHTPETPQPRSHVAGFHTTVTRLATCPYWTLEKVRFSEGVEEPVPYDEPVVWMVLEGTAEIRVGGMKEPTRFTRGDTLLLPAKMREPVLKTLTDCVWLETTFPGV